MRLTFNKSEVENLVAITRNAKTHSVPYTGGDWGVPKDTSAGLVLVGDNGVYFLSNADEQEKKENGLLPLAYAHECNPEKLDFDTVWENKREAFGGDDGCEFFALKEIEGWLKAEDGAALEMEIDEESIRLNAAV